MAKVATLGMRKRALLRAGAVPLEHIASDGSRYTALTVPCHWCGVLIAGSQITIDHIQPRSDGGGDNDENLVPACSKCNAERNRLHQNKKWRR